MKQVNLRIYRAILPLLLGLFLSLGAYAQQVSVRGHVKDTFGDPVIGANVVVKDNFSIGTITDLDGNFVLSVPSGSVLQVSFIGYKMAEVAAAPTLTITLQDDAIMLDEAVVIGYGSVRKSDLSGSVVAIKADEINRGAITSPQQMLQGKVPGLFVEPGNGAPGSGSTLRIRGGASLNASNDPLIVIDGIPVSNDAAPGTPNALATINPNDIETFTVLKDASATAIYGSRASNGVIIITTKKGSQRGVKVDYSSTYSFNQPFQKIKTLSANKFREVISETYPIGTSIGDNAQALLNMYPEQSTNWQDEVLRTAFGTDQNIGISGNALNTPFRVSLGYTNENGTLYTSNYERYTGSISVSPKFFQQHLSVDVNVKGTINNNRYADQGAISGGAFYDPTKPIYNNTGDFNGYWNHTYENGGAHALSAVNPLQLLYDVNNKGTTKRSLGNIQLDYKIHGLEDLRVNLNLGYDFAHTTGDNYVAPGSFQAARDTQMENIGRGTSWDQIRRNHVLDLYMQYDKELPSIKSRFNIMGGYSWQHFYYRSDDVTKSNPTEDRGKLENWTYDDKEDRYILDGAISQPNENYLVSFFGRMNYHFMDRYLLTATLRRDGSSRFSKNNRWGLFPSVALAWSVINESFMESTQGVLSNLKLRLGYGVTGQQEIGDYMYLPSYNLSTNPGSTYLGDPLLKPQGYSPDLKWEETATYNIAVDYGFLGNRINGSLEFYKKHTKDLLNTVSAPAGTNFVNEITANVGEMKNRGVEFNVNAVVIQTRDFSWDLGYNVTWNDSKITKLTVNQNPDYPGVDTGDPGYGTGLKIQKHLVGYAPNTFYLYQQVYDEDGNPIQNTFVDRNGDGQITEADRYLVKNPAAKVFMGLTSSFAYKNWDLGFNLRANLGNYMFNAFAAQNSTIRTFSNQGFLTNLYEDALKTGFTQENSTEQQLSDMFLENASFLRMDNITLGYSFKSPFGINAVSGGRLSFSVQNVFTISKYSGLDPEGNGIDKDIWPRPRTYTIGLNLNF